MNDKVFFKQCGVVSKGYNEENHSIGAIWTKEQIDRDGEVVLIKGGNLKDFIENPILVESHDWHWKGFDALIGNIDVSTIEVKEKTIESDILFDMPDPRAAKIAGKYHRKVARTFSMGFIVHKYGDPVIKGQTGGTIEEWTMLELSAVVIPSNPHATAKSMSLDEYYSRTTKRNKSELDEAFQKGLKGVEMALYEEKLERQLRQLEQTLNQI